MSNNIFVYDPIKYIDYSLLFEVAKKDQPYAFKIMMYGFLANSKTTKIIYRTLKECLKLKCRRRMSYYMYKIYQYWIYDNTPPIIDWDFNREGELLKIINDNQGILTLPDPVFDYLYQHYYNWIKGIKALIDLKII